MRWLRTVIADLAEREDIDTSRMAEAMGYGKTESFSFEAFQEGLVLGKTACTESLL